ncbi:MAG: TetR/AcrR family transcriptional regulator [Streptosporangiaceae bacterium]
MAGEPKGDRKRFRRLPADQRREEILDAAVRLVGRVPEVSIDDVAAAAGTSRASVYRNFDGRKGLYAATLRRICQRLEATLGEIPQGPPSECLEAGVRTYVDFAVEYGAVLGTGLPGSPEVQREVIGELRQVMCRWVFATLGGTPPEPVLETAVHAWVAGLEWTILEWRRHHRLERSALEALLNRQLFLTLATASSGARLDWLASVEPQDGPYARQLRETASLLGSSSLLRGR